MSSNITTRIYDNLKSLLPSLQTEHKIKFYQDNAPTSAQRPYIVFRIEDLVDTSPTYNSTLKFMVWDDRNKSSKESLRLADILESNFNRGQHAFSDMGMHSVLTLQQNIPSEFLTERQCIEQQYDVRIYERTKYYE